MNVDYHEPVNLGNPEEFTVIELSELVKELTGSRSKVEFLPLPVDDPKRRLPDITLARKLLDWSPKVDLRSGLANTIAWYKSRSEVLSRLS